MYSKYSTCPPWYDVIAIACASSWIAQSTISRTERLWPRWMTSAPEPCRMPPHHVDRRVVPVEQRRGRHDADRVLRRVRRDGRAGRVGALHGHSGTPRIRWCVGALSRRIAAALLTQEDSPSRASAGAGGRSPGARRPPNTRRASSRGFLCLQGLVRAKKRAMRAARTLPDALRCAPPGAPRSGAPALRRDRRACTRRRSTRARPSTSTRRPGCG